MVRKAGRRGPAGAAERGPQCGEEGREEGSLRHRKGLVPVPHKSGGFHPSSRRRRASPSRGRSAAQRLTVAA